MTPQLQTTETNCLSACIASLLDINLSEVPDFTQASDDPEIEAPIEKIREDDRYWYRMQGWLADRGLFFLEVQIENLVFNKRNRVEESGEFIAGNFANGNASNWSPLPHAAIGIAIGTTESTHRHAIIVTCQGSAIVPQFDPMDGGLGRLTTVDSVCFLVPRNIAEFSHLR